MKIEKINDNQIKCTLYRADLVARQLKMTELAYGTDKTRGLLKDMMEEASVECGFEINDNPLMIEATPISMDCIVLMITRVDDPDDIDSSFSDFSGLIDLLSEESDEARKAAESPEKKRTELTRTMYSFARLSDVIDFSRQVRELYYGRNSLYKSLENGKYYLILSKSSEDLKNFAAVCTAAQEYGKKESLSVARAAYIDEHFEHIIEYEAIQNLAFI